MVIIMRCALFLLLVNHASGFKRSEPFRNLARCGLSRVDGAGNNGSPTAHFTASGNSEQLTSFDKADSDIVMKQVETILLPKLFGHPQFRPGQREVISKVLAGDNHIMATIHSLTLVYNTRIEYIVLSSPHQNGSSA